MSTPRSVVRGFKRWIGAVYLVNLKTARTGAGVFVGPITTAAVFRAGVVGVVETRQAPDLVTVFAAAVTVAKGELDETGHRWDRFLAGVAHARVFVGLWHMSTRKSPAFGRAGLRLRFSREISCGRFTTRIRTAAWW